MFIHVLEQYLTYPIGENLQDRQAEALIMTILECTPKLLKNLQDYKIRATIMWCGASAVNGAINRGIFLLMRTSMVLSKLTIFPGIA